MKRSWLIRGLGALALAAAFILQGVATPAAAQTYTVVVSSDLDIGTVTAAPVGDSVFRVDPNTASVTLLSGSAVRITPGSARALVTVSCAAVAPTDCTKPLRVTIGAIGSPTNRERAFTRATFALGTAVLSGSPGPPTSGAFIIQAIGPNASKTFYVGGDITVAGDDSGLQTGNSQANFFAYVAESGVPSQGAVGRVKVKVLRGMTIAKLNDLNFGSVIKPATGSGTVTLDPVTNQRTLGGAIDGVNTPTPLAASFNVAGEGGQAFSLSVPSTFQMTGTATPLTVTVSSTASGVQTLSSTLGSSGSFPFKIGGSFPLSSTTVSGAYTGSFTISVAYN